ncbi:HNH endonuclease signature motif containing protein [Actinocrispum wychmicini]|uniref:HNH endonuclease n=1 Tax=Actinocrispum wychmicini TaxID=1213861 RepID=A0A4R2J952_9PSEU|nr:HNH endonuclease signature motif containing protein [Actinocrispum wychmicini]TCO52389.1 HNH endonuclease [Actinocrispum wychmicini]
MDITAPLWRTSDTELVNAHTAVVQRRRQLYAEELRLVAEMENRGIATKLGYSNTPALLMHTARLSRTEARHQLAQAHDLHAATTPTGSVIDPALPQTAEALARGEVDSEHVDAIRTTLADLPHLDAEQRATAEQVMLTRAAEDDPKALLRFGTRVRDIVDPDGPPPPEEEPIRPERMLRRHTRRDGSMEFKGHLDLESAQLFENLLKPFEKPHPEGNDTRGYAERAGDAFADVLRMAANCPDLPTHNGARTEVAVTISFEQLQQSLDDVLLSSDPRMTAREARRLACDAHILPAVLDGDSKPLDVAVPAYAAPAHIRRGLYLRDKGCAFPGCERPGSVCDAHHVAHWAQGGPTTMDNMALLCPQHHRLVHNSDWAVKMIDERPWFIPPTYVDASRTPRRNHIHAPIPSAA